MKVIPGDLIKRFHHAWSHGLVLATIFRWLSRLGITVVPYYLFVESNDLLCPANLKPILDKPYQTVILDRSQVDLINGLENQPRVESEFTKLWDQGCSCVCLTSEGSILGYVWFDLKRCNYKHLSFDLKDHEAYSFNLYTARHMRGRNIAPFLINFLDVQIQMMGRTRKYSITELFNTPAMKYKDKRRVKPHSCYIYINLWDRFDRNIKIKKMKDNEP